MIIFLKGGEGQKIIAPTYLRDEKSPYGAMDFLKMGIILISLIMGIILNSLVMGNFRRNERLSFKLIIL